MFRTCSREVNSCVHGSRQPLCGVSCLGAAGRVMAPGHPPGAPPAPGAAAPPAHAAQLRLPPRLAAAQGPPQKEAEGTLHRVSHTLFLPLCSAASSARFPSELHRNPAAAARHGRGDALIDIARSRK